MPYKCISPKNFFILQLLIFCLTPEVFSTKCYQCVSKSNGGCYKNPKNELLVDCAQSNDPVLSAFLSNYTAALSSVLQANTNKGFASSYKVDTTDIDCITMKANIYGIEHVFRDCAVKQLPCPFYIDVMRLGLIHAKTCDRCDYDGCNSSVRLTTGFWSISASLAMLIYIKLSES